MLFYIKEMELEMFVERREIVATKFETVASTGGIIKAYSTDFSKSR